VLHKRVLTRRRVSLRSLPRACTRKNIHSDPREARELGFKASGARGSLVKCVSREAILFVCAPTCLPPCARRARNERTTHRRDYKLQTMRRLSTPSRRPGTKVGGRAGRSARETTSSKARRRRTARLVRGARRLWSACLAYACELNRSVVIYRR